MSSEQVLSEISSSSSSDWSSSSREQSPARQPPAPAPVADYTPPIAALTKRKSKSASRPSKRSKHEDKNKKARKNKGQSAANLQATVAGPSKLTAKDIMGTDSDIEENQTLGKKDELVSYLCRRGSSGVSKQINPNLQGLRFVDFRLYLCSEIENVTPMNRWRHSIVTLKTKIDEDQVAYKYLVKFLKEIKKDFKDCAVTYSSTPNQ